MKTSTINPVRTIAICLFALACSRQGDGTNDAISASDGVGDSPGSCTCSDIDGKCSLERNKCKQGFKPRCNGSVDDCDCDCVQK